MHEILILRHLGASRDVCQQVLVPYHERLLGPNKVAGPFRRLDQVAQAVAAGRRPGVLGHNQLTPELQAIQRLNVVECQLHVIIIFQAELDPRPKALGQQHRVHVQHEAALQRWDLGRFDLPVLLVLGPLQQLRQLRVDPNNVVADLQDPLRRFRRVVLEGRRLCNLVVQKAAGRPWITRRHGNASGGRPSCGLRMGCSHTGRRGLSHACLTARFGLSGPCIASLGLNNRNPRAEVAAALLQTDLDLDQRALDQDDALLHVLGLLLLQTRRRLRLGRHRAWHGVHRLLDLRDLPLERRLHGSVSGLEVHQYFVGLGEELCVLGKQLIALREQLGDLALSARRSILDLHLELVQRRASIQDLPAAGLELVSMVLNRICNALRPHLPGLCPGVQILDVDCELLQSHGYAIVSLDHLRLHHHRRALCLRADTRAMLLCTISATHRRGALLGHIHCTHN